MPPAVSDRCGSAPDRHDRDSFGRLPTGYPTMHACSAFQLVRPYKRVIRHEASLPLPCTLARRTGLSTVRESACSADATERWRRPMPGPPDWPGTPFRSCRVRAMSLVRVDAPCFSHERITSFRRKTRTIGVASARAGPGTSVLVGRSDVRRVVRDGRRRVRTGRASKASSA